MKQIDLYIIEKLKLNKNIEVLNNLDFENELSEDFVFVIPQNLAWKQFKEKYKDRMIEGDRFGFIFSREEADEYYDNDDIIIYEIPEDYKYLSEFILDWKYYEITENNLAESVK